jgi:hypothetical protein
MTAQRPDRLIYEGDALRLFANPLEAYWPTIGWRPLFVFESTANWRCYVATWEIRSDTLVLIELAGVVLADSKGQMLTSDRPFIENIHRPEDHEASEVRQLGLSDLFPNRPAGVVATWFSGELHVPQGDRLHAVHMGYQSIFERNLVFVVEEGRVLRQEVINTGDVWRRQKAEAARERAKLMRARAVALDATADSDGWITCPHCKIRFTNRDKQRWDGEKHRSCSGRINLNP